MKSNDLYTLEGEGAEWWHLIKFDAETDMTVIIDEEHPIKKTLSFKNAISGMETDISTVGDLPIALLCDGDYSLWPRDTADK
jgi:hypothetical protein